MGQTKSTPENNIGEEIKSKKICIDGICLDRRLLEDILIATNNSVELSSKTPYVKDVNKTGSCNKGYGGKIIYSNPEGRGGLSGCNKCNAGFYKDDVSNTDCKICPTGYYCPDRGDGIYDQSIHCKDGCSCSEGEGNTEEICPEEEGKSNTIGQRGGRAVVPSESFEPRRQIKTGLIGV